MLKNKMYEKLRKYQQKSAWEKGVKLYAYEIVENVIKNYKYSSNDVNIEYNFSNIEEQMSGSSSWKEYSRGGRSLIYDIDIAQRLCTYSELKRLKKGYIEDEVRRPNKNEDWLEVQARALNQASNLVTRLYDEN